MNASTEESPKVAMRQFNYEPPKSKPSLNRHLELCWYFLMPLLVILVISVGGIWAGFQYDKSPRGNLPDHKGRLAAAPTSLPVADSAASFLEEYLAANYKGGKDLADSQVFNIAGTYSGEFGIQAFRGACDAYGNGKFILEFVEPVEFEFRDGVMMTPVSPLYEADAILLSDFINAMRDPLLAAMKLRETQSLKLERTEYLGVEAYKVCLEADTQRPDVELTVSVASLAVLERREGVSSESQTIYRYADHKPVGGIRLPHSVSIKKRSGTICRYSVLYPLASRVKGDPAFASR